MCLCSCSGVPYSMASAVILRRLMHVYVTNLSSGSGNARSNSLNLAVVLRSLYLPRTSSGSGLSPALAGAQSLTVSCPLCARTCEITSAKYDDVLKVLPRRGQNSSCVLSFDLWYCLSSSSSLGKIGLIQGGHISLEQNGPTTNEGFAAILIERKPWLIMTGLITMISYAASNLLRARLQGW